MLCRVADDRDDHGGDEELRQTRRLAEALQRMHQDLADERREGRRGGQREQRAFEAPRFRSRRGHVRGFVSPQVVDRRHAVEREQEDRHGNRQHGKRMAVRVAVHPRNRRDEEGEHGEEHDRELRQQRAPVEALLRVAAGDHRDAEDEQDVRHDASGQRAAHDVGESVGDREEGDDQLRRVAEARVEKTADARARVLARVLGRLADQPR